VRYLLLIYGDERALDDALREECDREPTLLAHPIDSAGQDLAVAPRQPTSMATSVRVRQGKRLVTDGPFAETREQLGGSFLIVPAARRATQGACCKVAESRDLADAGYRKKGDFRDRQTRDRANAGTGNRGHQIDHSPCGDSERHGSSDR
jgi:hypothetical protein